MSWSWIARLCTTLLEWGFAIWQKRERENVNPVNRVEDLQHDITQHNVSEVQDAFRRAELERRLRDRNGLLDLPTEDQDHRRS